MAAPTEEELILLQKFREVVTDVELKEDEQTDEALVKWLRAREMDLKEAKEMLRRSSQWRVENDIYNLQNWTPPESFCRDYYYEICGQTSTGCPVVTIEVGKWDIKKAAETGQKETWLKYMDLLLAKLDNKMKKYSEALKKNGGHNCGIVETQFIVVGDFEGFSMRQFTSYSSLNLIRELVRRYEANYPETLKKCFVVNASRVFQMLFRIIKPMLSARTLDKLVLFGTNQDEWKSSLLNYIPANQLSVKFGGSFVLKNVDSKE